MRWVGILAASATLFAAALAHAEDGPLPPPDPARLELARQLVEQTVGQKAHEAQVHALYGAVAKVVDSTMPAEQARLAKLIQRDMEQEMIGIVPDLMRISADVYARNLTEQELRDYIAFLSSNSGRSVLAKMPAILAQTTVASAPFIRAKLPTILKRSIDRACAAANCSVQVRQQVAQRLTRALAAAKS